MSVFTIVGAGMMGSALSPPLVDRGHEVRLVGTHLDGEIIESLKSNGTHPKLRYALDAGVKPFFLDEIERAMHGAQTIILGVNSKGIHWAAEAIAPFVESDIPIAMITKGLEWTGTELQVFPDTFRDALPRAVREKVHPVGITGPCIAGELVRRSETCVVFAGRDTKVCASLAASMRTDYYHVWTSPDVVAHEACAALKNAFAMGIAFPAGIHEARGGQPGSIALHNFESAVFAEAARETATLLRIMGGDPNVVIGLSGVGDLDVTTNGGRTGRFGRWLGTGLTVEQAIEKMEGATLECLDVLEVVRSALPALEASGTVEPAELPLLRHLFEVALDGQPVNMPFDRFFGGNT